ncbi:MAG: hypothetical protein WAK95_19315 [Desulfobacterales bacterium]
MARSLDPDFRATATVTPKQLLAVYTSRLSQVSTVLKSPNEIETFLALARNLLIQVEKNKEMPRDNFCRWSDRKACVMECSGSDFLLKSTGEK